MDHSAKPVFETPTKVHFFMVYDENYSHLSLPKICALRDEFPVIDGTNVREDWADSRLNLTGTNDIAWAKRKNKITESLGKSAMGVGDAVLKREDIWKAVVDRKLDRLGWTTPPTLFSTRFCLTESPEPWSIYRLLSY